MRCHIKSSFFLKQENHVTSRESPKETAPVKQTEIEEHTHLTPAPTIQLPLTVTHDKKTILKNAINQNEQIEKQSVLDDGDKSSLDNVAVYNESIDGTPPSTSHQTKAKNKISPKPTPRTLQDTNSQQQPQQHPHQPFPFPKKNLAKEKNSLAASKNNNIKKNAIDKENDQQKQMKTNLNTKNQALNKEPSVASFREDDQVFEIIDKLVMI